MSNDCEECLGDIFSAQKIKDAKKEEEILSLQEEIKDLKMSILAYILLATSAGGVGTTEIAGIIFLVSIIIKEVFVLLKGDAKKTSEDVASISSVTSSLKKECEDISKVLNIIKELIEDLHKWHDKEDDDGVKIWYLRRSLELSIKQLPITIDKQREVNESLLKLLTEIST